MIDIKPEENPKPHIKVKGCSSCPYAGHFELKECPDAYTKKSADCNLYSYEYFADGKKYKQEGDNEIKEFC